MSQQGAAQRRSTGQVVLPPSVNGFKLHSPSHSADLPTVHLPRCMVLQYFCPCWASTSLCVRVSSCAWCDCVSVKCEVTRCPEQVAHTLCVMYLDLSPGRVAFRCSCWSVPPTRPCAPPEILPETTHLHVCVCHRVP